MGLRTWLGLKKKRKPIEKPFFFQEHSYSQLQQDRWVLSELSNKKNGFFVEVGAFNGKDLSNTYLLEKELEWTGLLVEPNPILSDTIRETRNSPLDTRPVDSISGKKVLMRFVVDEPELSSMASIAYSDKHAESRRKESVEIEQTTVSLNDVLATYNAPTDIDYISIDTEGNELDILKAFNFKKYNVRLFSIEHNNTRAEGLIEKLLVAEGYERVYREWSRFDAWFRKRQN
ncbi:FkbM family methyltransferase [Agrobacterium sp. lyk4-40-TYG-31]|uniref:FkbM family methyltransferase n=1 Tax=Agrobacterium sp. lyk4-40-TYG-31 TaxID=3040276 RepID=UPI00254ECCEF|nr:FkbM family methyltransferase [Agrobacterium sp. lyk4-40-TYG-31]